jgi:hypothetical protein
LDSILFTGDGTIGSGIYPFNQGVCFSGCTGSFFTPSVYTVGIASIGFGGNGFSFINSTSITITTPLISFGHGSSGCYVGPSCEFKALLQAIICSNGIAGLTCDFNSQVTLLQTLSAAANSGSGCVANQARLALSATVNQLQQNGQYGALIAFVSSLFGQVQCSANNLGPAQATYASFGVLTGSTGLGGISPALNTVGNNNSYFNT